MLCYVPARNLISRVKNIKVWGRGGAFGKYRNEELMKVWEACVGITKQPTNQQANCSRVLLGKSRLSLFYRTRKFITVSRRPRQLSPPWIQSVQCTLRHQSHFLKTHLNIAFPSTPRPTKWPLSLISSLLNPVFIPPLPHTFYMPCPSHYFFYFSLRIIFRVEYRSCR